MTRRSLVLGLIPVGMLAVAVAAAAAREDRENGERSLPHSRQGGATAVYWPAMVWCSSTPSWPTTQGILDQVKTVTDKPTTMIINTHTHGDHVGSNMFFPANVEIVTHENTKANMEKMPVYQDANKNGVMPDLQRSPHAARRQRCH